MESRPSWARRPTWPNLFSGGRGRGDAAPSAGSNVFLNRFIVLLDPPGIPHTLDPPRRPQGRGKGCVTFRPDLRKRGRKPTVAPPVRLGRVVEDTVRANIRRRVNEAPTGRLRNNTGLQHLGGLRSQHRAGYPPGDEVPKKVGGGRKGQDGRTISHHEAPWVQKRDHERKPGRGKRIEWHIPVTLWT